jgi:hypothetical protein
MWCGEFSPFGTIRNQTPDNERDFRRIRQFIQFDFIKP